MPDIDIDLPTNYTPKKTFPDIVTASMVQSGRLVKHPCGGYLQTMPVDEVTQLAAIPYDKAEEYGFFKIDFLHLSFLDQVQSKQEIRDLSKREPDWSILWNPDHTRKLFHLHKHFDLLDAVRPTSVQELADCVALIRPTKRKLLAQYQRDKYATRPQLYRQAGDDKSSFKKGHAIAYALTIVVQLHLIQQGKL